MPNNSYLCVEDLESVVHMDVLAVLFLRCFLHETLSSFITFSISDMHSFTVFKHQCKLNFNACLFRNLTADSTGRIHLQTILSLTLAAYSYLFQSPFSSSCHFFSPFASSCPLPRNRGCFHGTHYPFLSISELFSTFI